MIKQKPFIKKNAKGQLTFTLTYEQYHDFGCLVKHLLEHTNHPLERTTMNNVINMRIGQLAYLESLTMQQLYMKLMRDECFPGRGLHRRKADNKVTLTMSEALVVWALGNPIKSEYSPIITKIINSIHQKLI
ncbi:MAG: hypothetical protein RJQ09_21395 [Cyclobacteriaceae bacterium]